MAGDRFIILAAIAVLAGSPGEALSDDASLSVSGDVGAVTKYVFRAQSALGNQAASVQGSLTVAPEAVPGLSLGMWYSTIDGQNGDEVDWIIDYTRELDGELSIGGGIVGYTFIDSTDASAFDIYGTAGFAPEDSPLSASATLYYTVKGDDTAAVLGDDDLWLELGIAGPSIATFTPSVTFQLSRYGEGSNNDFDLAAIALGLSKDISVGDYEDFLSVGINYSVGTGEYRNNENINNEFWAGFFINF